MSLANIYRRAWVDKFGLGKGWSANWWPGTAISLGERGIMRDGQLQHQGYVSDYGVSFALDPAPSPVSGPWDYSSSGDTKVEIGADASVPGWEWLGHASAGLSATFGSQESVYLSATYTTIERVADNDKLQRDLLSTAIQHGMPVGQSVVIERQLTAQAMIIASSDKSGELKATVSGEVQVDASALGAVASAAASSPNCSSSDARQPRIKGSIPPKHNCRSHARGRRRTVRYSDKAMPWRCHSRPANSMPPSWRW